MSGKQLSLPGSSQLANRTTVTPHNDLDMLVDQLLRSEKNDGSTAEQVLAHPQVRKHGILGRLTPGQQSLVTSVVSLMQDRVAEDGRKNADALKQIILQEREALGHLSRSFADTAKSLYQLPLLGRVRHAEVHEHDAPAAGAGGGQGAGVPPLATPASRGFLERFLTWGNFLAGTAIVLAVLVVKTSVATASYETQYKLTLDALEKNRAALEQSEAVQQQNASEIRGLSGQNAALQAQVDALQKQQMLDKQRHESELKEQRQALDNARDTLRSQQQQLQQTQMASNDGQASLQQRISTLQEQLAAAKARQDQHAESAATWRQLAEERKQEIAALQRELKRYSSTPATTDAGGKAFLGLF